MLKALIRTLQYLNWSIRHKIGLAFGVMLICFIVNGIISVQLLFSTRATDERLAATAIYLEQVQRYELAYKNEFEDYRTTIFLTRVKFRGSEYREVINILQQQEGARSDPANDRFRVAFYKLYSEAINRYIELDIYIREGDFETAGSLWEKFTPEFDKITELLDQRRSQLENERISSSEVLVGNIFVSTAVIVISTTISILLALFLLFLIERVLVQPLNRLQQAWKKVAGGDLEQHIELINRDEIGMLGQSFEIAVSSLRNIIIALAAATEESKATLAKLQETNTDLATAREAAEAASAAKSTFLANMSHELRTPLNAVIGYSEMLQEEAEDQGLNDFVPDLRKIHTAGKHLLTLINDILDLAKIEAGKMELYLEDFDVASLIQDVASTIHPLIEKNSNTLVVECDQNLGIYRADSTKLHQSLLNLLSNAAKFTHEGTITLKVIRQKLQDEDWITFEVQDSGIGMSADQLAKLFQPFTQADASTTRKYGGTGLGLVITRHFCQMMGGEIRARSEPNSGSIFTISLPAEVSEKPAEVTN